MRPICLKYKWTTFSTAYDIVDFHQLVALTFCTLGTGLECEIIVLPDFQPTEYLFEEHASHGQERWEIFSWAVRELMCDKGRFKKNDDPTRVKIPYQKWMCNEKDGYDVTDLTIPDIIK